MKNNETYETFVIDWGEKCNGGRYAILLAKDPWDLWCAVDCVGDPSSCWFANLSDYLLDEYTDNYIELEKKDEAYSGSYEVIFPNLIWHDLEDFICNSYTTKPS